MYSDAICSWLACSPANSPRNMPKGARDSGVLAAEVSQVPAGAARRVRTCETSTAPRNMPETSRANSGFVVKRQWAGHRRKGLAWRLRVWNDPPTY